MDRALKAIPCYSSRSRLYFVSLVMKSMGEVSLELFHPPTRTVQGHERDRLFKQHGIRVVELYDAHQCYERADEVVQGFLELVRKQT